jgi:hypothetical protein
MMRRRRKIHHETSEIYVREVLDGPIETNKKDIIQHLYSQLLHQLEGRDGSLEGVMVVVVRGFYCLSGSLFNWNN